MKVKLVLNKILLSILLMICITFYLQESYAETIGYGLGPITDLMIDSNIIYFFEIDDTLQSSTWLPDTQIAYINDEQRTRLSEERFIYPTELNQMEDFLFFATLSEECIGQITCDFQNIVKMSTKDGSFEIVDTGLKSAIHLSIDGSTLYVSESSGKIWKMSLDGSNKEIVYSGNNIIMDVSAHNGNTYWIEEVTDEESRLLQIDQNKKPIVIDGRLHIPYGLKTTFDTPTWNDVQVKPSSGSIADFTAIKSLDGEVKTIAEFKNTSPVSKLQLEPHYEPYFVYGDYIILANNTADFPVIQLLNYKEGTVLDLATIKDYEIKYFRSDSQNLYIVGANNDGFVIEKLSYPIMVPEFGSILMILMLSMIGLFFIGKNFTSKLS